jgi:hypothetical protein
MNVSRDVILDLVPLYLEGEASPASRALVEEYLKLDPNLAERIRLLGAEGFAPRPSSDLPPELELRALRRTRSLIGLQRWLFGLGITFTALALGMEMRFRNRGIQEFHLLLRDHPLGLGILLALGVGCLGAYFALRRRLRTTSR